MKNYAITYLAKQYIEDHMGLRAGTLVLERDEAGLIEFRVPVSKMRLAVTRLKDSQIVWRRHWFDHTDHWIAYNFDLDSERRIVVKHVFGGLKCRIQLIDNNEYPVLEAS